MLRRLEYAFAYVGLLFMAGAFSVLLTPSGAIDSPAVRTFGIVVGLVAVVGLVLHPRTLERALAWYWPTLIPCALALASTVWSVNSDLTFRRGGALLLTTAFAFWLVERFKPRTIIHLVIAAMFTLCVGSLVAIVVFPDMGVHGAPELGAADHTGAWRGLFGHKNDFGRASAFAGVIFIMAGLVDPRRWFVCLVGAALATTLVIGSRSSQAIVLLMLPSAIAALAILLRNQTARTKAVTVTISVCAAVVLYYAANAISSGALALLGKDETMSGRTTIWEVALSALPPEYYLGGGGYGAGWALVVDRITTVFGSTFQHAHNGYIDLFIGLGAVGVLLTLNVVVLILLYSLRATFIAARVEIAPIGLAVAIFFAMGNFAASFLLDYNSIYWVMAVVSFCLLRRPMPASARNEVTIGAKSTHPHHPQRVVDGF